MPWRPRAPPLSCRCRSRWNTAINRRRFTATLLLAAAASSPCRSALQSANRPEETVIHSRLKALESAARGRLGVAIVDTAHDRGYTHRADERFLMLSSFKLLACALVLHRVDDGEESLDRRLTFTKADLIDWSPVTAAHAGGPGLPLRELCRATLTTSDNTAANLILESIGGPAALTAFVRSLGDETTRFDRFEPALNVLDGPLDTTTPRAMAATLKQLLLGPVLTPSSRSRLLGWIDANTTGGRRLRAGVPGDWPVGEKTGTNDTGANDIGVIRPPGRAPLVVAAYLADSTAPLAVKEAALAGVGELVRDLALEPTPAT